MNNMNDLVRKCYNVFTKSEKVIAKFVLEQPQQIALNTAKQIGLLTETSETTVIRFSLKLGFTGYGRLQEEIRKTLVLSKQQEHMLRKFSELPQKQDASNSLTQLIMNQDIAYIHETAENLTPELLGKAVASIAAAQKIIVIGLGATHTAAYWLAHTLNIIRGNTILYRGAIDDASYLLTDLNEDCLIIALSFPRYLSETIQFVQTAKRRSVKVLALSDLELSPLGSLSDVFIKVIAPQPVTLKGMAVLFSLLNILISELIAMDHDNIQTRIDNYNEVSEQFSAFVNKDGERSDAHG